MNDRNLTDVQKYILLFFYPKALGEPDESMWTHLVLPEVVIPENITVTGAIGSLFRYDYELSYLEHYVKCY